MTRRGRLAPVCSGRPAVVGGGPCSGASTAHVHPSGLWGLAAPPLRGRQLFESRCYRCLLDGPVVAQGGHIDGACTLPARRSQRYRAACCLRLLCHRCQPQLLHV